MNAGFVRPTNAPPSNVDNIIGIDAADVAYLPDGIGEVQECKNTIVPGIPETQNDQILVLDRERSKYLWRESELLRAVGATAHISLHTHARHSGCVCTHIAPIILRAHACSTHQAGLITEHQPLTLNLAKFSLGG